MSQEAQPNFPVQFAHVENEEEVPAGTPPQPNANDHQTSADEGQTSADDVHDQPIERIVSTSILYKSMAEHEQLINYIQFFI